VIKKVLNFFLVYVIAMKYLKTNYDAKT